MSIPYQVMDNFMVRIPTGTIDKFMKMVSTKNIEEKYILEELLDDNVLASILVASPILYSKLLDLQEDRLKGSEKEKTIQSFLKYMSRYCSRSTPFGLFSGTFLGTFRPENSIIKDEFIDVNFKKDLRFNIRLDFELLHRLLSNVLSPDEKLSKSIYFANNTLYKINNDIRYLERSIDKDKKLKYELIEIETNDLIDKLLKLAKLGVGISQLIEVIVDEGYDKEEANDFINELIDSNLLISDSNFKVLDKDAVNQFIEIYKNYYNDNSKISSIISKLNLLNRNDTHLFDVNLAQKLSNEIVELLPDYKDKTIFNIDTYFSIPDAKLPENLKEKILEALTILNGYSIEHKKNDELARFAKALFKRYEHKEIPLSLALDQNLGIGYPINKKDKLSPLVDDLPFHIGQSNDDLGIFMSSIQQKMLGKITEAQIKDSNIIELNSEDLNRTDIKWNDLPDTIATISQICYDSDDNMLVVLGGFGGGSAGNLISRFCYNDNETVKINDEIDVFEKKLNVGKIIAEINHLVDGRTTNILLRPSFREFEIPVYTNSTKQHSQQILLDDIMVSSDGEYLKLRSKFHNKEVIPRLTSAHNYSTNDLPAYLFLCEYQTQNKRADLYFDLGPLFKLFSYIPRIQYSNIVLSLAKWIINLDEIKKFVFKEGMVKYELFIRYLESKNIDIIVNLIDGDSKLLLNLKNTNCIDILIKKIRTNNRVILEEFLFNSKSIIRNEDEKPFVNEFIFMLKKNV